MKIRALDSSSSGWIDTRSMYVYCMLMDDTRGYLVANIFRDVGLIQSWKGLKVRDVNTCSFYYDVNDSGEELKFQIKDSWRVVH